MQTDPGFSHVPILASLNNEFALPATTLTFLPIGLDTAAAIYRASGAGDVAWFVKVKSGSEPGPGPAIALSLAKAGIDAVLPPYPTRTGAPWATADGRILLVYPYIEGTDAVADGLDRTQWQAFGRSLRAIHDQPVTPDWRRALRSDSCAIPGIENLTALIDRTRSASTLTEPGSAYLDYLVRHAARIDALLDRARAARDSVCDQALPPVLCHGDIHAANILVGRDGRVHLVDWDAPLLAPRERDLMFVIGSCIAREVLSHEERWFFEGYGSVEVNPDALVLFRLERVIDDLYEFGRELLASDDLANPDTAFALRIIETFFQPDGIATRAEMVDLAAVPGANSPG